MTGMAKTKKAVAELSYNPYLRITDVTFNGRAPRINSLVEKHINKKLQEWIKDIPTIFHDEMNGYKFDLLFSGTVMDFKALQNSFLEAGVSKEIINLELRHEMESRITKTRELDELIDWLENHRNRVLDYDQFKAQNDDLLFGPFTFRIIKGNVKAINLYDNLEIEPENIASVDQLKNTDLSSTPILFYLDRETLPFLQHDLLELLKKKEVSREQIFFFISPPLRENIVERIIEDLGVEKPQVVSSLQADCIKQYFEMFPVSDYISDTLKKLREITDDISEKLDIEEKKRQAENIEKYMKIHEFEDHISALEDSYSMFQKQDETNLTVSWNAAEDKMLGQIQKWQTRRTKVTGEPNGQLWAADFDKQISKAFNEFTRELMLSFYNIREDMEKRYASWYRLADQDPDYDGSEIKCSVFAIGAVPAVVDELLNMKEEEYVPPKDDSILGFMFKNQQKPQSELVLETAYYFYKWRKYAADIAKKRADQLIKQADEILTKYIKELSDAYIKHLDLLISEEKAKKKEVTDSLSDEAKSLQNDKNWLKELEDKLNKIERE